ncbi:MAG: Dyp-type peroxidase [Alcanivoracaceae bacterium]|nr:Dyp-type peroxidase [Alcanivoracaceae bacterium]
MPNFQPAIFDKTNSQHAFLELRLAHGDNIDAVKKALRQLVAMQHDSNVLVMLAFGNRLWSLLDASFEVPEFSMEGKVPATQGDLLIWLQGKDRSSLFDASMAAYKLLRENFALQLEVQAFVYHDSRDLSGFVDGIGNPAGDKALAAAIVADGHPGAGGSFLITQKWVHDLDTFNRLSVTEQENTFGRTKVDAVEFDDDKMPKDSHVGLTDVDRDGVPQKIWRRSVPYGTVTEHGIYFVGFSCELDRLDYLLRNIYGMNGNEDVRDRLLDFTQPVTSSWWYVPTVEWLDAI